MSRPEWDKFRSKYVDSLFSRATLVSVRRLLEGSMMVSKRLFAMTKVCFAAVMLLGMAQSALSGDLILQHDYYLGNRLKGCGPFARSTFSSSFEPWRRSPHGVGQLPRYHYEGPGAWTSNGSYTSPVMQSAVPNPHRN